MSKFDEIKERCDKATPEPWRFVPVHNWRSHNPIDNPSEDEFYELEPYVICALGQSSDSFLIKNPSDRDLIVHARTDIPLLLKALELACSELKLMYDYYERIDKEQAPRFMEQPNYWLEQAQKVISLARASAEGYK